MGKLKNWAREKSQFLRMDDGEKIYALYKGYKVVKSRFEEEEETVKYLLEVDGIEKILESRAIGTALAFDKIKEGSWVTITRQGVGNQTKYLIEPEKMDEEKVEAEGAK